MEMAAFAGRCSPAGASCPILKSFRGTAEYSPLHRSGDAASRNSHICDVWGVVATSARPALPPQPRAIRPLVTALCPSDSCLGAFPRTAGPREAGDLGVHILPTSSLLPSRLPWHATGLHSRARSRGGLTCLSGTDNSGDVGNAGDEDEHERAASEAAGDPAEETGDHKVSPESPQAPGSHGSPEPPGSPGSSGAPQGVQDEAAPELLDWRAFRARLVATERAHVRARPGDGGIGLSETLEEASSDASAVALGSLWAHALHAPEKGCLLVASELLDGYQFFHRSVILLLGMGSGPSDGPYGIALNKSFPRSVAEIDSLLPGLATTFGRNQVHVGGPMGRRTVLMVHGHQGLEGHCEVMPGVSVGGLSGLASASEAVLSGGAKAEDFQVVLGYAGWQDKQLLNEVAQGWWYVAACNSEVVLEAQKRPPEKNGDVLWRDVLQLMGGEYAEVGNRCKGDN